MTFAIGRCLGRTALTLLALFTIALTATTGAESAWTHNASAAAAARAASLSTSSTPTAVFRRPRVTVTWSASTFTNGAAVPAYVVRRYNAATGIAVPGSNSCSGLVTTLTCSETAPAGTWRYTITAAAGAWRGSESPQSLPVVVA